jgi:hypothetical protein
MLIGGNPPVTATLPAGFVGGFHRVQVDGRTGQVVVNAMIGTHKNVNGQVVLDPAGVNEFAWVDGFGQPRQGTVGDTLVLMTSVGQTKIATLSPISNTDPRLEWGNGTQIYAQDYGASFHILNTLSDKDLYSMVGVGSPDPQLPFNYAVESSQQVQITPNTPVGRVSGFFKRSRQGYFVPVMGSAAELNNYNGDFSPRALNILEITYQPPSNWPYSGSSPYDSALNDLARALGFSGGGSDMRGKYFSQSEEWGGKKYTQLIGFVLSDDPTQWPGFHNGQYTQSQWDEVKGELEHEFDWLDNIHNYLTSAQQLLDNSGATNQADLKSVGDAVEGKVSASGSNKTSTVLGELFSTVGSVIIAAVSVSQPELAVGMTAVLGVYSLSQPLGADAGGKSADIFESTVDQLSTNVQNNTAQTVKAIQSIRVLLTTDYGKLSESGPLVQDVWNIAELDDPAFHTYLEQASTQNYYGTLMEQRWTAYTLEDPKTNLTYTGPGKKSCTTQCDLFTCDSKSPWKNVPESARFNLIWGYDKSGKPIQQGWFWGRDFKANQVTGTVPPIDLTDPMFNMGNMASEYVDLSMPIFWWQKNAARRFHCDGSQPHDSRTTGEKQ